ncbi:hypothetical protein GCM10023165_43670 [Variovorax defluvii]|uniref:Uncharacterized protein n=1 Tax=Variovorax defluvii TaxID=913761 RepID=A0ABP8I892_9BURK
MLKIFRSTRPQPQGDPRRPESLSDQDLCLWTAHWRNADEEAHVDAPGMVALLEAEMTRRFGGPTTMAADL